MKPVRRTVRLVLTSVLAASAPAAAAPTPPALARPAPQAEPALGAPWVRLAEEDGGAVLRLELAERVYVKEGAPDVHLLAAMHVAEPGFYAALERRLDELEVVLFEGVEESAPLAADATDAQRAAATRERLRFLAVELERHHATSGRLPEELAALAHTARTRDLRRLADAVLDGWGAPIVYRREAAGAEPGYALASLGADGAPGGTGAAADLAFADQEPVERAELEPEEGLQAMLADALGLVFQLDAMDTSAPSWRNSDLSLPELQERLTAAGVDASDLVGGLRGQGFATKLIGGMLKILGSTDTGQGAMKLVGIEVLARAEDLLAAAPGELGDLMRVLIDERNEIVLADLAELARAEPDARAVGVLYGAGHLSHLEERLVRDMGWAPAGERWRAAVTLAIDDLGLPRAYVRTLRGMIGQNLDRSLRMLEESGR